MSEDRPVGDVASLEALVEAGMLELQSLHPGGLDTTRGLAEACGIGPGTRVLDVASGTGETACFLATELGARVTGVDYSQEMVGRARAKADALDAEVAFERADAGELPFDDASFDAVICECTLCLLDKRRVLREMGRVVRPGGVVGMHDLCWHEGASPRSKRALAEIEGEEPETLEGWRELFESVGLHDVSTVDKSAAKARWMSDSRKQLGWAGQARLAWEVLRRWGLRGLWTVLRSEQVFSSKDLGYVMVWGTKG